MQLRAITIFVLMGGAAMAADTAGASSPAAKMERRMAALRKSPLELYALLYRMPKGADLHNHLSGAVYAESYVEAAIEAGYCVDRAEMAIVAGAPSGGRCASGLVDGRELKTDNALRNALIDSFSMRNFVAGRQSGHDHFFDTFGKFGPGGSGGFAAEVVRRAGEQNESYVELMALTAGSAITAMGSAAGLGDDFEATRKKIEAAGLGREVEKLRDRLTETEQALRAKLGCDRNAEAAGCRVTVRYQYQVLRESPKEQVFAQVLGGFALAALDPRVVGVNFVQPEDGYNSMHDYSLHMKMVEYARKAYPGVHVSLHAGELAPGLVPPEGLRFHIREAVETGGAERIGHGVDVMYERDAAGLLKEMRERHVAVEINLTSNDGILGVTGDQHPLPVYRKYGVPVMLSTDDEGVSRSHLTTEYQRAVTTYNLSYSELKDMVRNSLEYSFAPGASYWKDHKYGAVVAACSAGTGAAGCKEYLGKNEKARLEADLEERFAAFEKSAE